MVCVLNSNGVRSTHIAYELYCTAAISRICECVFVFRHEISKQQNNDDDQTVGCSVCKRNRFSSTTVQYNNIRYIL